ncbi:saccharopine dehydrogenase-like oxidoreductase [Sphaerochaeta pleomorpha str. Grapes]|uniref:Saccharopine dehydrogenase-like oxidoreductase n=1 Tax=Sphaerochaeta pleomorpha (strain ATCC BAA-1885 / DSM 22778 / Grapes) TaxID=158190 RepID=G8QX91_SPHPG|nr:saccharopine dehydrogenase family protein [Sphaerochaeta pleomorpha]AEV30676.1 saccharopine dehydrogenase-like oxidoreductase [Sphaerochaeta pleomorpha str. Grapes]
MKKRLMIIGAGGVGNVVARKSARMDDLYETILLASRTKEKCDAIAKECSPVAVETASVDADDVKALCKLMTSFKPDLVINVALPYQDLSIMQACLETGVHYVDTANYEPKDKAEFEYSWQWAYQEKFKKAGLTAILGSGFDPGVTNVFTSYVAKHYLDEIHYLDIVDCNAGDHGKSFATNFNPEINIREITQHGKYWENGVWKITEPLEIHQSVEYPRVGPKESYLLFHEELESLVKHYPTIKRARFWMTFSQQYITYLQVLENVGMTSIKPIKFNGIEIQPLQFLKAVLPEPSSLGEHYEGQTSIGCQIRGLKQGEEHTVFIYNNCSHQMAYRDAKAQGVSFTTGVPASIGGRLLAQGVWKKPGVWNMEQFDPDPFMELLPQLGLPWELVLDGKLAFPKPGVSNA